MIYKVYQYSDYVHDKYGYKEKPQQNETMDDMVKRLAFWIIYTKAVEHYKYMKEE